MATNPLVAQGTLNRLRGSVVWPAFPALNVTAPFLGQEGIGLTLEGETTVYLPSMTGAVRSGEPYQMIALSMNLLKTQALADAYKRKMESDSALGDGTVRPDASTLSPYPLVNCSIEGVRPLSFAGRDAGFVVSVKGYYLINSDMWNL